jgi:hypothetical protein
LIFLMKFESVFRFRVLVLVWLLGGSFTLLSQEISAVVTVNSDQVSQTNQQIFRTLERSLSDFLNQTRWTTVNYAEHERLNCRLFITVTRFESGRFEANLQLQSSRPVFNTNYESPIFNYRDNQFNFEYIEFQPLVFNENVFNSNLVGVISYYVYIMLGIDADTFKLDGGTPYFRKAQALVTQAQGSGYAGWGQSATDGRTRFQLVDNLLSNTFSEYRNAMYNYHRLGIDLLASEPLAAKEAIVSALKPFEALNQRRPNAFLIQLFFDAKAEEIQNIFSEGPQLNLAPLKQTLGSVAPFYSSIWNRIRN